MLDTYTGKEDETLEVLKIYPMKTLALEEKTDDQTFEEYDPNQIIIKVNPWLPNLTSLGEEVLNPVSIKVNKDSTMHDFLAQLSYHFHIPLEHLLVLKRNPMMNINSVEVLSDHADKRLA